jgi:hypothetical protein
MGVIPAMDIAKKAEENIPGSLISARRKLCNNVSRKFGCIGLMGIENQPLVNASLAACVAK